MTEQVSKRSIFISYSRKDKEFVRKLNDSLDTSEIEAWVDWEGIPPSSDWMEENTRAIEGVDAFLFVISPDSLASEVCGDELELGIKLNKKLMPILHRDPERGTVMHDKLSSHNWVYLRDQDDYDAGISKVFESISVDLEWVRQHTHILQRAREWENQNRNNNFLLQGSDLEEAEQWRSQAAGDDDRQILPLQGEYIDNSRKADSKRQRNLLVGISLALVVSVALAIFAVFQSNLATENAHAAATAQAVAEEKQVLAVANEALSLDFSPDNKFLIIGAKEGTAYLIDLSIYQEVTRLPHVIEVTSAAFSGDGAYLATVSFKATQLWDISMVEPIYKDNLLEIACARMTYNMRVITWKQFFFYEPYHLICPNLPVQDSPTEE